MAGFPIIDRLGGEDAAFERLREMGYRVRTKAALRMWRSPGRGQIPGDAVVLLMRFCERAGIPYSATDFVLTEASAAAE